ncbi:hypothetical protein Amme3_00038 [Pseudomonas phage vB_PpuM-Amme-3]|uniref:Uncharacterized protein n=1 Tax=Pseudomonas phage vB_PpuM-Amme-3 TaxID=3132617 RepID=A0AAX4MXA5_9CAUD
MSMQDVVHDLLLEHGYDSPKDRVVDMICYIIPKSIKAEAAEWGWSNTYVKESIYAWMKTNVQRGND